MAVDLFAGIPVSDYPRASAWYERLLGSGPSFLPNDTEAVWELAEHRYLYIDVRPEHAGHAMHTLFVDDLDVRVRAIADRVAVPVVASGGVGGLDDLVAGIRDGHASAVLAASIFHFGQASIGDAHAALAAAGIPVRTPLRSA